MLRKICLLAVILISGIASAHSEQTIRIDDAWVRPTAGSKSTSAAYMNIVNLSGEADVMYKVTSAMVGKTELHKVVTDDQGVHQMVMIDKIVIPAEQTVKLAPKGLHIMLFKIKHPLNDGDKIELTIHFENAGAITLQVPVIAKEAHKTHNHDHNHDHK